MSLFPESIQPKTNATTLRDFDRFASDTLARETDKINLAKKILGISDTSVPLRKPFHIAFEELMKIKGISLGGDPCLLDLSNASPTQLLLDRFRCLLNKKLGEIQSRTKQENLSLGEHLVAFDAAIYDLAKALLPYNKQEMAAALNLIFRLKRYGIIRYYMDKPTPSEKPVPEKPVPEKPVPEKPVTEKPVKIPEYFFPPKDRNLLLDKWLSLSAIMKTLQKEEERTRCETFIREIDEKLDINQFTTESAFNAFVTEINTFLAKLKRS